MKLAKHLWSIACETKEALIRKYKIKEPKSFKRLHKLDDCAKNSFGHCSEAGMRIGLKNPRTGRYARWETIINTVCHEMAHIKHLHHKKNWFRLYRRYFRYIMRKL